MKFDSNPVLLTCGVSADVSSYPVFWLVRTILDFSLQASALATLPDWSLHSRWAIRMPLMYVADPLLEYLEDFECASQYLAPVIATPLRILLRILLCDCCLMRICCSAGHL